jgi:hypothetical protein
VFTVGPVHVFIIFDSVQILTFIRVYVGAPVLNPRFKILVFWNVTVFGHEGLYRGTNTSGASAASLFRVKVKVKLKESRNRPGVTQRVPGGLGSQIP